MRIHIYIWLVQLYKTRHDWGPLFPLSFSLLTKQKKGKKKGVLNHLLKVLPFLPKPPQSGKTVVEVVMMEKNKVCGSMVHTGCFQKHGLKRRLKTTATPEPHNIRKFHFRLDPSTSLSHSFAFIRLNLSHFPLHISDILKVSSPFPDPISKSLIPNFLLQIHQQIKMCASFCCYWNHQVYGIQELWYILKNTYKQKLEKLSLTFMLVAQVLCLPTCALQAEIFLRIISTLRLLKLCVLEIANKYASLIFRYSCYAP